MRAALRRGWEAPRGGPSGRGSPVAPSVVALDRSSYHGRPMRWVHHILAVFVLGHLLVVGISAMPRPAADTVLGEIGRDIVSRARWLNGRYGEVAATRQVWGMFSRPGKTRRRLEIAVRHGPDAEWQDVFVERSERYTWRRASFEQTRWRETIINFHRNRYRRVRRRYAEWVADHLFDEHPDAEEVRVRILQGRVPPPGKLHRGIHWRRVTWERVLAREGT